MLIAADPLRLVLTTVADEATAVELARTLVGERLADCATLLPGARSIYRWEGRIEEAAEVQLLLKTTAECLPALTARLEELHPYQTPEIVVLRSEAAGAKYLAWVAESLV